MGILRDSAEVLKMVNSITVDVKLTVLNNLGILTQNDYLNLVQCETLDDLKLHLQSTDYGNFLANESSLQVSVIDDKLREKLVTEFQHMRNHATGQLACFLDYITYGYMIDNIVLLITGTLHQRFDGKLNICNNDIIQADIRACWQMSSFRKL